MQLRECAKLRLRADAEAECSRFASGRHVMRLYVPCVSAPLLPLNAAGACHREISVFDILCYFW
jgi:hypothetical protein